MTRVTRILIIASLFLVWGQAAATIITYDYQFDTPTFTDPPFAPLNTILQGAGPVIEGTITVDTDKKFFSGAGIDAYDTTNGGFVHTGELDSLGFDGSATFLWLFSATDDLYTIFNWPLVNVVSTDAIYIFDIIFATNELAALCVSDAGDGCDGADRVNGTAPLSNLSIRKSVAEPTTLTLMAFGLAGLGLARRKVKT